MKASFLSLTLIGIFWALLRTFQSTTPMPVQIDANAVPAEPPAMVTPNAGILTEDIPTGQLMTTTTVATNTLVGYDARPLIVCIGYDACQPTTDPYATTTRCISEGDSCRWSAAPDDGQPAPVP
jgi:hypothetical protein